MVIEDEMGEKNYISMHAFAFTCKNVHSLIKILHSPEKICALSQNSCIRSRNFLFAHKSNSFFEQNFWRLQKHWNLINLIFLNITMHCLNLKINYYLFCKKGCPIHLSIYPSIYLDFFLFLNHYIISKIVSRLTWRHLCV